ncbi:peptidoglycan D,D-transpeptidase FtsI family protein [Pseudolysinimonas sp.]|uniref:peptidoglycan D,D-transpeptidase FtsI family protein n=1 Tax=Pseudolysinimonas sp. TaxID=2680009 RepID=UPI003F81554E
MSIRRRTGRRLAVTVIGVFALLAVFVGRLVDIQVVQAESLTKAADARQTFQVKVYGSRGSIVDTDGTVLASSVDRFDITTAPSIAKGADYQFTRKNANGDKQTIDLQTSVQEIADITGADPQKMYQAIIRDPNSNYAMLVKQVPLAEYKKVMALGIPWIYPQLDPARTYPNGAVGANLVGLMGTDGPLAGVELSENSCLAGTDGYQEYRASANGVALPGSTVTTKPAVAGGTVKLTIDHDLQWFAQQTVIQQVQATGADTGSAIVVRVADGHIMAAADYDTGDPNDLSTANAGSFTANTFVSPFEPGSIMKPATVAGLVEAGKVTASTPVDVPSKFVVDGATITDVNPHGDLHLTVAGVIEQSSNIGIAQLTKLQSEEDRYQNLVKFGFGQKTASGFYGEDHGTLRTPAQADPVTRVTQQFGQGMTATTAQIGQLYQTLGNDGVRMPLTLVEGCTKQDGTVVDKASTQATRVVSAATAQEVRSMMQTVYQEGPSSKYLQIPGYNIAAKTGTAQVADPATGKYIKGRYIVSVAGLVPADKPQYAVIFTLAKPQTVTSSVAAAPGWKALTSQVIKAYRVPAATGAPSLPPVTW